MSEASTNSAACILELVIAEFDRSVDRALVRRVMGEAQTAYSGDEGEHWWRWISEAGANLGLTCKVVDGTTHELSRLALDGEKLVVFVPGPAPWRAVTGVHGSKFRLANAADESEPQWVDAGKLGAWLGDPGREELVRCVVVQPSLAYPDASGQNHSMTPWQRLVALLRPERGDILILTVFSLVVGLLSLATPIAVDVLVTTVAFGRLVQPLLIIAVLLFAFLSFSAAIRMLKAYVTEIVQCRLFARVAADLSYRLPRIRVDQTEQSFLPELLNRFFDVVTLQKVTASFLLDGLQVIVNALVGMAVLAFYHPWLLTFDVVLLGFMCFAVFVLGRGAVATSIQESKYKYHMAAWLEDLARCSTSFKLDGGAEFALERGDQLIDRYLTARRTHFRILMRQIVFALGLQALASAVLLGTGGYLVMRGQLTIGQLVAAELIITVIVGSFAKLGKSMESFYDLMAAVDKLGVLFDLPIEDQEGLLHQFPNEPASLTIHDVDYSFSGGRSVLTTTVWEIRSGERVVLNGLGKSVLLDLIYGLRTPAHGHVSIDGIDIRDLRPDFLRRRVALVRGIEVFQGSVAENVDLARPDITSNAVRDTLEQVGLLSTVLQLPDGIETMLTSSGRPLTETQLRRLMLARALAGRPGLLLVDGILDAFPDDEAEELLQMLCDGRQCWTLVMVGSHASFRRNFSRIIDLGTGSESIAEVGESDE